MATREAIVDGVTGFLVPCGSVTALAEALSRILNDPDLRLRLGRAARQRFVNQFLFTHQERDTRYVYENVLYERRRVTPKLKAQAGIAVSDPQAGTAA